MIKTVNINNPEAFAHALEVLNSGGLIAYPTETCYGVGVDATNVDAVSKLLEFKKRPEGKAISIAVASKEMALKFVEINSTAESLYKNFLPGPVTIISKSKGMVDKRLESEIGTLGIRIPNYKPLLNLIEQFGKPITSTSANSAGRPNPYSVEQMLSNLSSKQQGLIDLILDGGVLPYNPPSTVIDTTTADLTIYRQGRLAPDLNIKVQEFKSDSESETITFGHRIVKEYYKQDKPLIILLNGELGAGKTHLTKGIAKELGITQMIKSPTFNYVSEYKFGPVLIAHSPKLYHLDAWRIQSREDLEILGVKSWFTVGNVIVIEWPTVLLNLDENLLRGQEIVNVEIVKLSEDSREFKYWKQKV